MTGSPCKKKIKDSQTKNKRSDKNLLPAHTTLKGKRLIPLCKKSKKSPCKKLPSNSDDESNSYVVIPYEYNTNDNDGYNDAECPNSLKHLSDDKHGEQCI